MFQYLDEEISSPSESEDTPPSAKKSKRIIAKVVHLREKLQKEDKTSSEEELGPVQPEPLQLPDKKVANLKTEVGLPSITFGNKIQVEEIKLRNIQLLEKRTTLQRSLEKAVREKNFELADSVNDCICTNESAIKLNQGVIEEDYRNKLREKEELKVKRKRKKLGWVFETKKKWETKANM